MLSLDEAQCSEQPAGVAAQSADRGRRQTELGDQVQMPCPGRHPQSTAHQAIVGEGLLPGQPDAPDEQRESSLQALQAPALITDDPAEVRIILERLGQRVGHAGHIGLFHPPDISPIRTGTIDLGRPR
ncbi:MAG TPA: hypothetical protein VGF70_09795 [Solirubrobacteraceae bacterium]|jgi:hypothetical protein